MQQTIWSFGESLQAYLGQNRIFKLRDMRQANDDIYFNGLSAHINLPLKPHFFKGSNKKSSTPSQYFCNFSPPTQLNNGMHSYNC
jgi:hypothetical protein